MRRGLVAGLVPSLFFALVLCAAPRSGADAVEAWQTLPPTPTRPEPAKEGHAAVNGIELYHAVYGQGDPVILLHGGLGNSDYWGHQIPALAEGHRVIVVDSRGHGRSTRDAQAYGYDLMASDVIALMDHLGVPKASIVGWSDGGIIGLDIAMNHPDRIDRLFAVGANSTVAGLKENIDQNPTFAAYIERAGEEHAKLSPTPGEYDAFLEQIGAMWASQPNWAAEQLGRIKAPVAIAVGEHDEAIRRDHTEELARQVPGAKLLILLGVSHFAMLQDPARFNAAVLEFLAD
jgi:pimeloyl-ACP methyl ester carboxylesterase